MDATPPTPDLTAVGPDAELDLRVLAGPVRPYVVSNFAMSLDGRIAIDGRARGIGSAADLRMLHHVRTFADAVLVGAGTVRAERYGPMLAADGREAAVAARRARGQADHPVQVVVSARFDLPWDAPLFASGIGEVLVATARTWVVPPSTATPVRVVELPSASGDGVDLPALLRHLRGDFGVRMLLTEGGARLHRDLLAADLLDELLVTIAPRLVGDGGAPTIVGGAPLEDGVRDLELAGVLRVEDELFTRWRVRR